MNSQNDQPDNSAKLPPRPGPAAGMNRSVWIAASIMCADFMHLAEQVRQLEQAEVDRIHVDIMDAHFVPNMPVGLKLLEDLGAFTQLPLDVHLMVDDNERFLEMISRCRISQISVHLESARHLDRLLAGIQDKGIQAGVALNPSTPLSSLAYVLERMDFLLLMTANPGFAGLRMVPSAIRKIADARQFLNDRQCPIPIEVDGNVSLDHIPQMVAAGADILVGGSSSVFLPGKTMMENVRYIRESIALGLTADR